jgi:hypothetical protein
LVLITLIHEYTISFILSFFQGFGKIFVSFFPGKLEDVLKVQCECTEEEGMIQKHQTSGFPQKISDVGSSGFTYGLFKDAESSSRDRRSIAM